MRSETRRRLMGYVQWAVIGGVIGIGIGFYFILRPSETPPFTSQSPWVPTERALVEVQSESIDPSAVAQFMEQVQVHLDGQEPDDEFLLPEEQRQFLQPRFVVSVAPPREQSDPYVAALSWRTKTKKLEEDAESALQTLDREDLPTPVRGALQEEAVFLLLSGGNRDDDSEDNGSSKSIGRRPSTAASNFTARMQAIWQSDVTEDEIKQAKNRACSIDDPGSKARALLLVHAAQEKVGAATDETLNSAAQARSDVDRRDFWPLLLGLFVAPVGVFFKAFINEIGESFGQVVTTSGSAAAGSDDV